MKRDKGKRPKTGAKGAIEANRLFGQLHNSGERTAVVFKGDPQRHQPTRRSAAETAPQPSQTQRI